jgi:GLPGLI family protein
MKKLFIVCLLSLVRVYSQSDSIQVEYNVYYAIDKNNPSNSELEKSFSILSQNKANLNFVLNATKFESYFFCSRSQIDLDINSKLALSLSGYHAPVYFDKKRLKILENHDDIILGKYVLSKEIDTHKWIITNEKKQIASFSCYKAYTDEIVINPKGEFTNRITVWFTTEIPFSYGPLGLSGLPGLILEMNKRNVVFGAKLIRFKEFNEFEIIKLDEKNAITVEKVKQMREDFINNKD